jgi:hypothetical protein
MIDHQCVPYKRPGLYWLLTIPMIASYIFLFFFIWQTSPWLAIIYAALFVGVALCMSVVCVYWQCPYVGKFAPCVGGFCLPSSRLALLWKGRKISEKQYNFFYTTAFTFFFAIILYPLYFLAVSNVALLIGYIVLVTAYTFLFMGLICPKCATRHVCPGGKSAVAMMEKLGKKEK